MHSVHSVHGDCGILRCRDYTSVAVKGLEISRQQSRRLEVKADKRCQRSKVKVKLKMKVRVTVEMKERCNMYLWLNSLGSH